MPVWTCCSCTSTPRLGNWWPRRPSSVWRSGSGASCCSLFTAHALIRGESEDASPHRTTTQDRTVLRELISQETTGERAGWTVAPAQRVPVRCSPHWDGRWRGCDGDSLDMRAQAERRRQRTRGGARTVGLAGYTNAGNRVFRALSGKEVLVEDRLFSTLETTVRRMEASP